MHRLVRAFIDELLGSYERYLIETITAKLALEYSWPRARILEEVILPSINMAHENFLGPKS